MWSSTRILWDQQILLMWILLPPVFVACVGLALTAPFLVRRTKQHEACHEECVPKEAVVVEGGR